MMAMREIIAINLIAYKPTLLVFFSVDKPAKKPTPIKIEQMAVAGDILPGFFAVNSSGIIRLSIDTIDKPKCSAKVNVPIKIIR